MTTRATTWPNESEVETVAAAIKRAFNEGASSPPRHAVAPSTLSYDDERRALEQDLAGKPWWTIDERTLYKHRQAIPLLTEEAFRYYIPAYLVASLGRSPEADDLRTWVLMALDAKSEDGFPMEHAVHLFEGFGPEQKIAIRAFFKLMARFPGRADRLAEEVAAGYWDRT